MDSDLAMHLLSETLYRTTLDFLGLIRGGPARTRTWNQGIRLFQRFPFGADYLFTLRTPQ